MDYTRNSAAYTPLFSSSFVSWGIFDDILHVDIVAGQLEVETTTLFWESILEWNEKLIFSMVVSDEMIVQMGGVQKLGIFYF